MAMRIMLLLCLLLGGCAATPQSLGITGPGRQSAVPSAPANPLNDPDALQSGARYAPNYKPTTDGGRFWGYN